MANKNIVDVAREKSIQEMSAAAAENTLPSAKSSSADEAVVILRKYRSEFLTNNTFLSPQVSSVARVGLFSLSHNSNTAQNTEKTVQANPTHKPRK